jgi:hypothetical protein
MAGKNSFSVAALYIVALIGLFAFQLWSLSAAIVGAIIVILAISVVEKSAVSKKISGLESTMDARHRELSEKVGQQMLGFNQELENTKASINRGLFAIESRLGRIGEIETKYFALIEKLIAIENKIGAIRTAVEEQKPPEQQPSY